jgi:hypothetical protein
MHLSPVAMAPAPGLPAYLRTPAAAMIAVGAIVVAFGIGAINRAGRTGENALSESGTPPQLVSSQSVPAAGTRSKAQVPQKVATLPEWKPLSKVEAPTSTRTRVAPVATYTGNYRRDRELEAKAARDIREVESIAKNNEAAQRAQEAAAQQQAYLRNLFSRSAQMPQSSAIAVTPVSRGRVAAASDNATSEDAVTP